MLDPDVVSATLVIEHPWWYWAIPAWPGDAVAVDLYGPNRTVVAHVSKEQWDAEQNKPWELKEMSRC